MSEDQKLEQAKLAESWYSLLRIADPDVRYKITFENCWAYFTRAEEIGIKLSNDQKSAIQAGLKDIFDNDNRDNISVSVDDILYYPSSKEYLISYNFTRDRLEINGKEITKVKEQRKLGSGTLAILSYLCMLMEGRGYKKKLFKYYRKSFWSLRDGSENPDDKTIQKIESQVSSLLKTYRIKLEDIK